MTWVWFGIGCFLLGISLKGTFYTYGAIPAILCFFVSWLAHRSKSSEKPIEENNEDPATQKFGYESGPIERVLNVEESISSIRDRRKLYLEELEEVIDRTLLDALAVLKKAISAHSLAIFVPHRIDGLYLRVWISDSDAIIPGAKIGLGDGLVGLLLKEDVGRILERDIVTDSTMLLYYSEDDQVKSIAGVPIIVKGTRRGAVVVDSLKQYAFDKTTVRTLENMSAVIGQFMYAAYTSFENSYQRDQLAALSTYQRKFLENMSENEIIVYLEDYIVQSVDADRFMLVGKNEQNDLARVLFCSGLDQAYFTDFEFRLSEKGLIKLVFEKEQIISKSFSNNERVPRLSPRERMNESIKCLLAVPVRTDAGVTHVLMLESAKQNQFNDHQRELLLTISRAAAFALSRARLYEEKRDMSRTDGLTGLINHITFQERYKEQVLKSEREKSSFTLFMLDVDHFKKVNDTYGHQMGDTVLKAVSNIIQQIIESDGHIVARYGGEEFVCILKDTSIEKAKEYAIRIRKSVKNREFEVGPVGKLNVTLSIGASSYPTDSKYGQEILEKADKALYHAKKTGRDRIVFYSE